MRLYTIYGVIYPCTLRVTSKCNGLRIIEAAAVRADHWSRSFFLKNSLDGHRLVRHDKSIIGNGNAATDNLPCLKSITRIGNRGERDRFICLGEGRRRTGGAVSINLNSDSISVGSIHIAADGAGIAALVIMRALYHPLVRIRAKIGAFLPMFIGVIFPGIIIYMNMQYDMHLDVITALIVIGDLLCSFINRQNAVFNLAANPVTGFVNIQFSKIDRVVLIRFNRTPAITVGISQLIIPAEIQTGKPIMIAGQLFEIMIAADIQMGNLIAAAVQFYKLTEVVIDASNETESIGGVAAPTLQEAIMAAQGTEIDNISGATVTTNAVKKAAASCIEQAMGVASEEPAADTAGDTGDDWLGEEPDVQASETQDFDVVIIGAGLSGVCAARAAAEEGAKVAIVEKSSSFNCRSGEYALLNGSLNKRWGRENIVDEDVVVDRLMRECTYRNKRSILKKWASHAHEVMDWFIEAYPELTICDSTREAVTQEQFDKGILVPLAWPQPEPYDYRNEEFPTFPSSMEFRSSRKDQQGFIVEANLNKAVENGAQTFFGCFGTKLLKDSDGRVTGVIIRDAQNDNKYIQLNASKGVILATGDNSGDEKIMKHFAPEIVEKKIANMGAMGMLGVDVEGKTVETGDGLRMGAWIGAKVQDFHAPMTHHMGSGMGVTPFLQINKRGDRFMNECIPGQQLENQIELQPECTSFQLYDSKWGEEVPYMPANHGGLCYIIPEDEDESNPNYTDRQYTKISAKAEAYQFKADTLEDLLTQCGFEGDALDNALASVERYNELAKAGSDDDFGKPASRMFALENPPYYACQWGTTSMLVCVGGLESDENCHTFTEEDPASPKRDIIKGLYVCGNVQGSRYAVEYPICMRGISHSLCVYYGYIAGKNCVAGV